MPNYCSNTLYFSKLTPEDETFIFNLLLKNGGTDEITFNNVLPYPDEFRIPDEQDPIKYPGYNSGGYKWRLKNWGCAWDAEDSFIGYFAPVYWEDVSLSVTFATGNSSPIPFLLEFSKKIPDITLNHIFEDDNDGKIVTTIKNGVILTRVPEVSENWLD